MQTPEQVSEARRALANEIDEALAEIKGGAIPAHVACTAIGLMIAGKPDLVLAALRAEPARAAEEMPKGELRHYPERVGIAGDMGVIDRQFGFVRCILPYDYKYTSNSQQWDEARRICLALEGPMSAQGVVAIRALAQEKEGGDA